MTEIVTQDAADAATFHTLVSHVEQRCLHAGAESMRALFVPETTPYECLRQCGFVPRRMAFPVHYIPLHEDMQAIRRVDQWRLQAGDFDVV